LSQLPSYGAGIRNQSFYNRFLRAKRYLDDHGVPMPDTRIHATWNAGRIAVAVAALLLAVIDGVLATTGHGGGIVFVFLPIALVILTAAMVTRRTDIVPWAALLMGLIYLIEKAEGDPDIGITAIYAVVLLVVFELMFTAGDQGTGVAWERPATVRRWVMFTGLVLTSLAAALVVGMVGSAGRLGGAALFGFGVGAAVLALIAVVRFVRTAIR
jgi:hypothetical protein